MRSPRTLHVVLIATVVLASCSDNKPEVVSPHTHIDSYSLKIDDVTPPSKGRVTVSYPEEAAEFRGGFYFDLERRTPNDHWSHVAVLGAPIFQGDESSAIQPGDERAKLLVQRIQNTPLTVTLPALKKGSYRLVQDLSVGDNPAKRKTFAVQFSIE